ncbi:hypothetical protein AAVH_20671 [Aphelenchoides avenae]|nr:hypothetical protein AAVH_20671 [Aphelenchus avenae]
MSHLINKCGLGNENLVDVFANLDRNTLDTLQMTYAGFGYVVREHMNQVCLRLVNCTIAVVPELDYKVYEVSCSQTFTEQSLPTRKCHSIGDVFAHHKSVTANGVLNYFSLREVALTDRFLDRFEAAMKGARVLGRFDVLRCRPEEDVKGIRLVQPFAEINSINVMFCSGLNIWKELGADAVSVCCDKRLSLVGPLVLDTGSKALEACFGCDAVSATLGYRRVFAEVATLEKDFIADLLKRNVEVGVQWTAPLFASIQSSKSDWHNVDLSPIVDHEVSATRNTTEKRFYRIVSRGVRLDIAVQLTDDFVHVTIKRARDGLYFSKNHLWDACRPAA